MAAEQRTPGREDMGTDVPQERVQPRSLLQRMGEAASYVITGVGPKNWFGPMQPLPPFADKPEQGTRGRAFDYPTGINLSYQPRSYESINFSMLRGLAESYDLLRLVIETRKDQIESYEWEIIPRDEDTQPDAVKDEIRKVTDFLQRPDKEHDWSQWLRLFIEDMLVIDAVAIYPQATRGGELYALQLINGANITRLVDVEGRTPVPPSPAYQHILKGVPAVDYTTEELTYIMRNPRTWKVYGYSPVEQIITTVNIAIRRQLHQLQFYTEGNVPEALVSVPESWTSENIKEFQMWWDSLMEGNTAARRHMKFIPKTENLVFPKEAVLKDEYDEWLSRIICFAFSIAPNALIRQMNRASSNDVRKSAKEEGLVPLMRFFKGQMNNLIWRFLSPNVQFHWKDNETLDALTQAKVNQVYISSHVKTPDEVRGDLDLPPLTDEQRAAAWPDPMEFFEVDEEEGGLSSGKDEEGAPSDREEEDSTDKLLKRRKRRAMSRGPVYKIQPIFKAGDTIVRVPPSEPANVTVNVNGTEVTQS